MLKLWQLRYWALLTGKPMTGTKGHLTTTLIEHGNAATVCHRPRKVVSVDMGIRNLAFCAVEIPRTASMSSGPSRLRQEVKVSGWKKQDLLSGIDAELSRSSEHPAFVGGKHGFTPAIVSRVAYNIVCTILAHEPDIILIEQQRFRSGGASAIQEWTIRVNMLESMLWACLTTLRARQDPTLSPFPTTIAVDPAKVGRFWDAGSKVPLRPPVNLFSEADLWRNAFDQVNHGRKVTKQDRIAILRSWMSGGSDITLDFQGQAAEVAAAFQGTTSRSKHADARGKLDDLSDCLLQAVAWARWEENRLHIEQLWEQQKEIRDSQ